MQSLGLGILILISPPSSLKAQENARTLRETLAHAQGALAAGDYATANETFDQIAGTFGDEPEVRSESFRIVVTPLHAYAALLAGKTQAAINRFESFLQNFPEDRSRRAFVLYNLARAYQQSDQPENAIETYRRFVALDPKRPEAALATLSAATLMFESGAEADGFQALANLVEDQPDGVLRNKARLTALEQSLATGDIQTARSYLLDEPWQVTSMPELAVLAFNALEMGRALLEEGAYSDAIAAYRLVPPYPVLLESQRKRLAETRSNFESRINRVGLYQGGQFWTQFYRTLIARLEHQLASLEASEDYTPSLYLSYGQAYLLAGRAHEAWILFETLTRNESLPEQTKAEAHYRWILAAIQVGVWEDAFRIAKGFGERFPDSPLVPDALYLLATAHQEAGQYRDAIKVLDAFINDYPAHRLTPRVLFVRGYNYNLLNEPVLARQDFEAFTKTYPKHGLYYDARFWKALTYFAEKNYATTLEALEALKPEVTGHRLEPEVAYRIASTLYSKTDYENALSSIQNYLERYPQHLRHEEGRVLLGDIQMGRGELTKARTIFASIQPSAGHLFAYALFQTGKILRAVAGAEDREETRQSTLESHLKHFTHYLNREDIVPSRKARISEALYWIGWTQIELGFPEKAREVFKSALDQYGDDIEAEQVPNIIDALSRIEKRVSDRTKRERVAALRAWIEQEKEQALQNERFTYFSRLNFYLSSLSEESDSSGLLFETVETVPIEKLDPEGLGKIAATLAERYPSIAEQYLERLEDEYPDNRHRSYGYYARALLEIHDQDYVTARQDLARFRSESPMHPLSISASLLYAKCLTQTKRFDEAQETLEEILKRRQARGRPHAEALMALSRNAEASDQLHRAIPYAQRVYNVYRAYTDLAAEAYWLSARQFEAIGDSIAAYRTLDEMLADPKIQLLPIAQKARDMHSELLTSLPEGSLEEASVEEPQVEVDPTREELIQ